MNVEPREIGSIRPYEHNPRNNRAAIPRVAKSIQEFGVRQPIVVDRDGVIIAGHTRYWAAIMLGLATVPVHVVSDLTEDQIRAYRLADNKTAEYAEWDQAALTHELALLDLAEYDLALTGFAPDDIARMLGKVETEKAAAADAVPEVPQHGISRPGAIYVLGNHRLAVGDARDRDLVRRLVGEQPVDLLLTDPPYGVDYVGKTKDALKIEGDAQRAAEFRTFLAAAFRAADQAMRPGAAFYIWHAETTGLTFRLAAQDAGWEIRQCLVWAKNTMVMGRQDYHWQHEPCLYGWKGGAAHQWVADRKQTTLQRTPGWHINKSGDSYAVVFDGATYILSGDNIRVRRVDTTLLEYERPTRSTDHPTMKPAALFEYLMLNSTKRGQVVLDTFVGSGTTVIAAERLGRQARVVELAPAYADVVRRRWAEYVHGDGADWVLATPEEQP